MIILTVKRYLISHWEVVALIALASIVVYAIYNLFDHIIFKPRREREAKRIQAMQAEIENRRLSEEQSRDTERKKELAVLLENLLRNGEILETHFDIIQQNWHNWNADKITSQIKNAVKNLENEKQATQKRELLNKRLIDAYNKSSLSKEVFDSITSRINTDEIYVLERDIASELKRHELKAQLILKYGEVDALKVLEGQYWLGMTEQHLIDSLGQPTSIQKEILKTKEKVIYIYGKKTTGDVFTFVNGVLDSVKDR